MDNDALRARIGEVTDWYHTIELAPGIVTPGYIDMRKAADKVLPEDMSGTRALDIGTFDGVWAFEMEKRGAAEVVAIDLLDPLQWDWPHGSDADVIDQVGRRKAGGVGFEIARDAMGSSVERHALSVYDLDPEDIGTFDFVYVGSLLLHLRDPVLALERARAVCAGEALIVDAVDAGLSALFRKRPLAGLDGRGRPWWWKPNVAGLVRMIEAGGFEVLDQPARVRMKAGAGQRRPPLRPSVLRTRAGREQLALTSLGGAHAAVRARPR
ncbi:MAG: class I SAM-dependent methyltransferase [Actinobacteria bacterium]|nr:class I SAM-dependent methyltransferase [Actinomycetota bacterium]